MAVTCDRCLQPVVGRTKGIFKIKHEGFKVEVWLAGSGDFCDACFAEIVKNGTVVEGEAAKAG